MHVEDGLRKTKLNHIQHKLRKSNLQSYFIFQICTAIKTASQGCSTTIFLQLKQGKFNEMLLY